jgi:hypothetical protein
MQIYYKKTYPENEFRHNPYLRLIPYR